MQWPTPLGPAQDIYLCNIQPWFNKLACFRCRRLPCKCNNCEYIRLGWKSLTMTNTLAYFSALNTAFKRFYNEAIAPSTLLTKAGNPYWRKGSVQLTSLHWLVNIRCFSYWRFLLQNQLTEEVNRTEVFPFSIGSLAKVKKQNWSNSAFGQFGQPEIWSKMWVPDCRRKRRRKRRKETDKLDQTSQWL